MGTGGGNLDLFYRYQNDAPTGSRITRLTVGNFGFRQANWLLMGS